MKHYILACICLGYLCLQAGYAQSPSLSENFMRSRTARVPASSAAAFEALNPDGESQVHIQYFDGLGRPVQLLDLQSSPNHNDVIQLQAYDVFGRSPKNYLPFIIEQSSGEIIDAAEDMQADFYLSDPMRAVGHIPLTDRQYPFSQQVFESAMSARVLEQGAPGQAWQPVNGTDGQQATNEHTILSQIRSLDPLLAVDQVAIWQYDAATSLFGRPTPHLSSGTYAAGELIVQDTRDENGHQTITYVDKLGRTILERKAVDGNSSLQDASSWASTYYLYDDFGQLRLVVQPEGVLQLANQSWNLYAGSVLADFAFQYRYDARGRMVEKRIPGADWIYMVYDSRDRIVLSQNGEQRSQNQWSFTKYDALDRPIITGLYNPAAVKNQAQQQAYLDGLWDNGHYELNEWEAVDGNVDRNSGMYGYSRGRAFPEVNWGTVAVHSITYYDHYDFDRDGSLQAVEQMQNEPELPSLSNQQNDRVRGMPTGVRLAILNPDPNMPAWLMTRTFYDDYGRELQTVSDNHLGGMDILSYQYTFTGEMLQQIQRHEAGGAQKRIRQDFNLDHRGRITYIDHQVDNEPTVRIEQNTYNELGQLVEMNLHSQDQGASSMQSVDYQYHIRGWLTDINAVDPACNTPAELDFVTSLEVHQISFNALSIVPKPGQIPPDFSYYLDEDKDAVRFDVSSGTSYTANAGLHRRVDFYQIQTGGKTQPNPPSSVTINFSPSELLLVGSYAVIETAVQQAVDQHFSGFTQSQKDAIATKFNNVLRNEYDGIFGNADALDLFKMKLHYEDGLTELHAGAAPQYNGNISGIEWQTAQACAVKGYGFAYDHLNRLQASYFAEQSSLQGPWDQSAGDYNTSYAYDQNGNMLVLMRTGPLDNGNFGPVDQLLYTYTGNQLLQVDETANLPVANGVDHFLDGGNIGHDYSYDLSGNVTQDLNRDVTMAYNHFNKPVQVDAGNGENIQYIYSADGTKLRQKLLDNAQTVQKTTDYINGFQYEEHANGFKVLTHFAHPQGRILPEGGGYQYQYFLKDHLGNTRVVFGDLDGDGLLNPDPMTGPDVAQIAAYYPFGMRMSGTDNFNASPVNQYLYNGKEVQDELGLGWLDYGARMYDASIARWNGVDALAEKYVAWSPYNYTLNNPIRFVDPDGRSVDEPSIKISEGVFCGNNVKTKISSHTQRERMNKIEHIVLHRTVGNSAESAVRTTINKRGNSGFHVVVAKNGEVIQVNNVENRANHVGKPTGEANNYNSIGIEVVGMPLDEDGNQTIYASEVTSWEALTPEQIESTSQITAALIIEYGLSLTDLIPHEDASRKVEGEGRTVLNAIKERVGELVQPHIQKKSEEEDWSFHKKADYRQKSIVD